MFERVYAAARAVTEGDEPAGEAVRRVLLADPSADPELLAARAARLAAHCDPHPAYARMDPEDRDAVVLARALGWTSERIAVTLGTTEADVRRRLARGLRTLLPPRDCAAGASPARVAHVS